MLDYIVMQIRKVNCEKGYYLINIPQFQIPVLAQRAFGWWRACLHRFRGVYVSGELTQVLG